jgi:molybdate/tungstate transport system permease protein
VSGIVESPVAGSAVQRRFNLNPTFTTLLILLPFTCVCLLLHRLVLAALFPVAGLVLLALARPAQRRRPDALFVGSALVGSVLLLFVILPILNLFLTTGGSSIAAMARDKSVDAALEVTLGAGLISTILALAAGVPLGYVLAREQFPGKSIVEGIIDMPVAVPQTIAGIALLFIFGRGGVLGAPLYTHFGMQLSDTLWGIVAALLFVSTPFVVNLSRDGFMSVDPRMEYVARSLGASPVGACLRVTLPLTWRPLLSAAIMAWARATSEFGSIIVIAYYPKSINTLMFEWYNFFGYAHAKPLAALLLLIVLGIFITLRTVAATRRTVHARNRT